MSQGKSEALPCGQLYKSSKDLQSCRIYHIKSTNIKSTIIQVELPWSTTPARSKVLGELSTYVVLRSPTVLHRSSALVTVNTLENPLESN
jgi:hypothetical protein